MSKDIPLHKRTHFRRIREVIKELGEYEGYDMNYYDLMNIRAYDTIGESLKGRNVSHNIKNNRSCWVADNQYDIFEVPNKRNKEGSPYGNFLYLAFNKSFQYFIFGEVNVSLDIEKSKHEKRIIENVQFKNSGKYDITFEQGSSENHIHKAETGKTFDPGEASNTFNYDFDKYNSRKIAYKTDKYKILSSIGIKTLDPGKIVGDNQVIIYKDKSKKKRRVWLIEGGLI